ncbi:hypothetical protein JG688_00015912 [Phytophthora aleatoria]|uniref:Uncharacterized protein n=1 Tax=Phytophthora aleatoria TaxID=2496075 RepID=A0A8J5IEY7_9STRA|nr:hypothetical protein JG688_00015912 [Phytophthora aleatoria]
MLTVPMYLTPWFKTMIAKKTCFYCSCCSSQLSSYSVKLTEGQFAAALKKL